VDDRGIEQRPVARHVGLRHAVDEQDVPQSFPFRPLDEPPLGRAVAEQQEPDVLRFRPMSEAACSVEDHLEGMRHSMLADIAGNETALQANLLCELRVLLLRPETLQVHAVGDHADLSRVDPARDEVAPEGLGDGDDRRCPAVEEELQPLEPVQDALVP
jgi:hypothetical protein